MTRKIAFLGTGIMGAPMAANLIAAGHEVTVWNRSAGKTDGLVAQGARAAESPAAAVAGAELVLIMLSDGPAVHGLLIDHGLADALPTDALVIDCSSIDPATARAHAADLAGRGIGHLDAPVSGGPSGAQDASLAIMVGGTAADWARGQAVLAELGRPTHVGPAGAGQLAKLANQIIVGLAIGAVAEALLLAEQGGADPAAVRQAMTGGFADSKILQIHGERMLKRTFLPGGPASMHLKDMTNILAEAEACGLELPLTTVVAGLFRDLVARGGAGYDHSALLLEIEQRNPPARLGGGEDVLP